MTAGTGAAGRPPLAVGDLGLLISLGAAALAGGAFAATARAGAVPLLAAVAVVQAALAFSWAFGTALSGRRGAVVVAVLAAAGSDVAVSRFPHGRLGALLIVVGLALPVLIAQQLLRGAVRFDVTGSLGGAALLLLAEVALAALPQIRSEFTPAIGPTAAGGTVAAAAAAVPAGALVIGYLTDMVIAAGRFDRRVPRGLPAVAGSGVVGAALGYLILRSVSGFGVTGTFVGGALGLLAGLLAVAAAFVQYASIDAGRLRRAEGAVAAALLPIAVLLPVAFLLLLAVRR